MPQADPPVAENESLADARAGKEVLGSFGVQPLMKAKNFRQPARDDSGRPGDYRMIRISATGGSETENTMIVKSDPECSGADLTKRFVINEEDIISAIQSIMFILSSDPLDPMDPEDLSCQKISPLHRRTRRGGKYLWLAL